MRRIALAILACCALTFVLTPHMLDEDSGSEGIGNGRAIAGPPTVPETYTRTVTDSFRDVSCGESVRPRGQREAYELETVTYTYDPAIGLTVEAEFRGSAAYPGRLWLSLQPPTGQTLLFGSDTVVRGKRLSLAFRTEELPSGNVKLQVYSGQAGLTVCQDSIAPIGATFR